MTYRTIHTSLSAGAAIAAALAISSTHAFAQDAAPAIDAAPIMEAPVPIAPAPVTAPPPQIVLPPELTAPAAPTAAPPVATTAAPTAEPAPTRAPRAAVTARRAPATTAVATPSAEVAEPASPAPIAAGVTAVPPVAIAPSPSAEVAPTPVAATTDSDNSETLAIAAILAGLFGIGAAGTMALRRRNRSGAAAYAPEYEPVASAAAAVPARRPVAPVAARPVMTREMEPAGAGGSHSDGWMVARSDIDMPFAMPGGPVPTGEARERLLAQMVAARPDSANPFTSHGARRKRARIILQARAHHQREAATRPFDFRTYQPETASERTRETVDA